jgi:hypothetical protein
MVARPISLHEQNPAIFGQKSKHTLMSCGLCLVLRAASRTVEELIQEEIMYGDYVQSWEPHGLLKS